jgi:hypothetical protein
MVYIAILDGVSILGVFTDMAGAQARVVESQAKQHPENLKHIIEVWEFEALEPTEVIPI